MKSLRSDAIHAEGAGDDDVTRLTGARSITTGRRLRRLTPLRFVAASFVVLFHFGQTIPPFDAAWIHPAVAHGYNAVSFFYCLSGFIMATIYHTPMNWVGKAEYWIARAARIYPVYLLALVATVFWMSQSTTMQIALSALLLQSWVPGFPVTLNGPAWSLSVEMLFYVLFPFMASALARDNLRTTAAAAFALWVGTQFLTFYLVRSHYGGYPSRSHDFIFYFPMMHLDEFLLGAVAGAVFRLKRPGFWPAALAGLGAVASVAMVVATATLLGLEPVSANGLYAPLFLAAIWIVASLPRVALLEHRFAVALGEASYAMYLLQFPVMYWFGSDVRALLPMSDIAHFYFCVTLLLVVSLVLCFAFEQPMRSMIKRVSRVSGTIPSRE
jgi:peptidoglycan/LPS O-acetylase OafA/YrhL